MKRIFLFGICLIATNVALQADEINAVKVQPKEGDATITKIDEMQKITFVDDQMVIQKTDESKVELPIADVQKITFVFAEQSLTPTGDLVPNATNFSIYGREVLQIECSDGIRTVQLFDVNGRLLCTNEANDLPNETQLNVSGLPAGVFVVRVTTSAAVVSQKIIVK